MEKIKNWVRSEQGKDILVILIVILVGLGSFELGRLSKASSSSTGLKIEFPAEKAEVEAAFDTSIRPNSTTNSTISPTGKKSTPSQNVIYFASKRGHKYYPMDCSAGKTIVMENRIYFDTRGDAEAAGYTLSASCQ